ncbi:MAG: DUF2235 domain-containing protein [Hydrogenophaga sp.]|uniref:DUF2235 domain-containing protein n=1 Tax=Hydrogenophaga sp. TaxID=1904254 RepID=UPI0025C5D3E6|nr:DUF2235 domain-containing protein [Hydrogenophaga sp.]MBU7572958.1 DUF2235 domain-containing protein [Hydrogenophaga sp.]
MATNSHSQGLYQNETTTNTIPDSRFRVEIDKIQVNLFFDGTLNNYFNVTTKDKAVRDRYGGKETSYDNALSNVARMWDSLDKERDGPDLGVYVEGMGTTELQGDDIAGKALGTGETGMRSRAQSAFGPLKTLVAKKRGKQGLPALLELNLFGFSRGAATARHFASLLRNREEIAKHFPGRWSRVVVQVNFVGLFDTVSAEGLLPGNDVDDLQLRFEDDAARRVFHLVALDEYRENFALTNIASACRAKSEVNGIRSRMGYELGIPGAHSDVGGGYKAGTDKPEPEEVHNLPALRSVHDRDGGTTTLPGPQAFVYAQGWYSKADHQPAWGQPHRHVRQVQGDYHKVGLSLMVDMAERHTTTQYPDKLKAEMQAQSPEVAQVQQQLRAFAKDNAFVAWKPAQQSWGLEANLGTEQAKAFRRRFLHLSCSDAFAMQPRYRAGTEQMERGHVFG